MPNYLYHPKSIVRLGLPIDGRRPLDDKTSNGYFTWEDKSIDDQTCAAEKSFTISEIQSREELYKSMSIDANVEAKFGLGSAGASLNWEQDYKYDSRTIIYVVNATKLYNPEYISGTLVLSNKGKRAWEKAVRENKILEFQKSAGTEVVTRIRRGNSLSLIYIFKCTTASSREAINSKLSAGWATGSVSINFEDEIKSIDKSVSVEIKGFQTGVGSVKINQKISDIIQLAPGDIVKIKKIVSKILDNVSPDDRNNSPIIEYNTRFISEIEEIVLSDDYDKFVASLELNEIIDGSCILLHDYLLTNIRNSAQIKRLLDNWNVADYKPDSREKLDKYYKELNDERSEIFRQYRKCISAKSESDCNVQINSKTALTYADFLIAPIIIPLSWSQNTIGIWTGGNNGNFITTFYPNIHIKYINAISGLYVVRDGAKITFLTKDQIYGIDQSSGSLKSYFIITQTEYDIYVYHWQANLVASQIVLSGTKNTEKESSHNYNIEIILDDGSIQSVDIGNAATPVTIPITTLQEIPEPEFSNLKIAGLFSIG
ncbi:MAG: hypothetical protein INR69_15680 [Mucilaginibacter polytrichastri]|nr:hypothetical protein [Mucilaginibacter polytrichastri]